MTGLPLLTHSGYWFGRVRQVASRRLAYVSNGLESELSREVARRHTHRETCHRLLADLVE
jgi:hypothetical protein